MTRGRPGSRPTLLLVPVLIHLQATSASRIGGEPQPRLWSSTGSAPGCAYVRDSWAVRSADAAGRRVKSLGRNLPWCS